MKYYNIEGVISYNQGPLSIPDYEQFFIDHGFWKETTIIHGNIHIIIHGQQLGQPFKVGFPKPPHNPELIQRVELEIFLALFSCWIQDCQGFAGRA